MRFLPFHLLFQANIIFSWDGWADGLSGLSHYEYEIFELVHFSDTITEGGVKLSQSDVPLTTQSVRLILKNYINVMMCGGLGVGGWGVGGGGYRRVIRVICSLIDIYVN